MATPLKLSDTVTEFITQTSPAFSREILDLSACEVTTVADESELNTAEIAAKPYSFVYAINQQKYFLVIPEGYSYPTNGIEIASAEKPKVKVRVATDSTLSAILLEEAEIAFATDTKKLYIGDGSTLGGNVIGITPSVINTKILERTIGGGTTKYGRMLITPATTDSTFTISITSSTGYAAVLWWDGTITIQASGTFSKSVATNYSPREIVFWACSSATSGALNGNITTLSSSSTSAYVYHADLTRLTSLTSLNISAYIGTAIDLSKNTALTSLTLKGTSTYVIPSLNLSSNTLIDLVNSATLTNIASLDISNNTVANDVIMIDSSVNTINVSNTPYLGGLLFSSLTKIKTIVNDDAAFGLYPLILFSRTTLLTPDDLYRLCSNMTSIKSKGGSLYFIGAQESTQLFVTEALSGPIGPDTVPQPFKDGILYTGSQILAMVLSKFSYMMINNGSGSSSSYFSD